MDLSGRIPGLDGLRGIAASIVLLSHMSQWGFSIHPFLDFSGIGRSGVILFFILSAFLLTTQVINWGSTNFYSINKWSSYVVARFFRIVPLFLVVVSISFALSNTSDFPILWKLPSFIHALPVELSKDEYLKHLVLLEGKDILWTIPVEFKFYFILPIIVISLSLIANFKTSLIRIIFILSAYIIIDWSFLNNTQNGTDTLPFISVFLAGILLATIMRLPILATFSSKHALSLEIAAWTCIAFYLILIPSFAKNLFNVTIPLDFSRNNIVYTIIWSILLFSMISGKGILRGVLESKIFVYLGAISYSMYLWHRAPIKIMHRLEISYLSDLSLTSKFIIIIFFTILIAHLSYYLIEKPFLSIGKRIRGKVIII